jgi:hypothetical protein
LVPVFACPQSATGGSFIATLLVIREALAEQAGAAWAIAPRTPAVSDLAGHINERRQA